MPEKILITSALPYANGPIHFGHIAGAYLPADCYARFQRLRGQQVLYICGSDEYGVAITLSAEMAQRTPKAHVDLFHEINKKLFETLDFSFDHFSRTSWEGHIPVVQQFFLDLLENGYIEERTTNQLYSEQDRKFLADRYVLGTCPKCGFDKARGDECQKCGASYEAIDLKNPHSKITGHPLVLKPTKHWFMRFDLFKDRLEEWLNEKKWKPNVLNFARSYVEELRERAITRDMEWGVPVPLEGAEGKVLYVWFDAPIGYISATKEWAEKTGNPEAWKEFWCDPDAKLIHFIGKDNIPFHAVFFPAMVMGQNTPLKLVDELPANEFLNLEGKQFSKSEGWYIDLEDFFKHFTADQIRYYLASNAPETHDSEFSWKEFQLRCNSELLGKFGNLANRTLVFAQMHCGGKIPPMEAFDIADEDFIKKIAFLSEQVKQAYETFSLRKASQHIMEIATTANVYFDAKKPWLLAKDPQKNAEMQTTIACCLEALKILALTSFPILPHTAEALWKLLGYHQKLSQQRWNAVVEQKMQEGAPLPQPEVLFKKVEDELIEKQVAKLKNLTGEKQMLAESTFPPLLESIGFEDFKKVDLRVGLILEAEKVPKSKKLLKLTVDMGFEKRTIVSGIAEYFADPITLIGKKVAIVANLKPAKLMGIESQGMLLVATLKGGIELPSFEGAQPGDQIT